MRARETLACGRELGAALREYRKKAGMSAVELGRILSWTSTKMSRTETGRLTVSEADVVHYLAMCGVRPAKFKPLISLCRERERGVGHWITPHQERVRDSLNSLMFHESTADRLTKFEIVSIPGLLQTEGYIRALFSTMGASGQHFEYIVKARLDRKRILRTESQKQFRFYIREHGLRVKVGSAKVMNDQMMSLMFMADRPNIEIRVIPSTDARAVNFGGDFYLLEQADHRPLVFLDALASGMFLEDTSFVRPYQELSGDLANIALSKAQSREVLAEVASSFDRAECDCDVCADRQARDHAATVGLEE